jgi:hypothetical protein
MPRTARSMGGSTMKGDRMTRLHTWCVSLLFLVLASPVMATVTTTWNCNSEADMAEYKAEYSSDGGVSWIEAWRHPHPKPCTTPLTHADLTVMKPGEYKARLFAIDTSANNSDPGLAPATFIVPTPIPAVSGLRAEGITQSTAAVKYLVVAGVNIDVRIVPKGGHWGQAVSLGCDAGTCQAINLTAGEAYDLFAIHYAGVMNQGAVYGDLFGPVTFTTLQIPPPTPPPPPLAACENGKDDDGDGKIDFPADPGCTSKADQDETDPLPPVPVYTLQQAVQTAVTKCIAKSSCSGKDYSKFLDIELKKVTK